MFEKKIPNDITVISEKLSFVVVLIVLVIVLLYYNDTVWGEESGKSVVDFTERTSESRKTHTHTHTNSHVKYIIRNKERIETVSITRKKNDIRRVRKMFV